MNKRDIEFLYEIGSLRHTQRTWVQFNNPNRANVAEHTLRVVWTAMIIAKNEKKADLNKVIKIALIHDVPESRTGDVHYLSRMYTDCNDELAINDILEKTSLETELINMWEEYEERKSIESKIVKDADNIDAELELKELLARGNSLPRKWKKFREDNVRTKMFTTTGKKLWDELQKSDPDDWHVKGKNRFTKGGWKKK